MSKLCMYRDDAWTLWEGASPGLEVKVGSFKALRPSYVGADGRSRDATYPKYMEYEGLPHYEA